MKYRLILTALLLSFSAFSQTSLALTDPNDDAVNTWFNDVNGSTLYKDSIYWSVNEGITSGYADGSGNWGPDACVTRAELLKMMVQYEHGDVVLYDYADEPFTDVESKDWFYKYVVYAENFEIVEGYSDGTFKPNNCVNRVEAMKVAVKTMAPDKAVYENSPMHYDSKVIVDMSSTAWYAPYAKFLFQHRLVGSEHTQGVSYTNDLITINFLPDGDMSRKEVAYMMHQIDKYLDYNKPTPPPEPKDEWYEWDKYNISVKIPLDYYVHPVDQEDMLAFTESADISKDPLSALWFIENTSLEEEKQNYDSDQGTLNIAGRKFHVMEKDGFAGKYYLLEVEKGVMVYYMDLYEDAEALRNKILSMIVVPNEGLQLTDEPIYNTDYFSFGNGAMGENVSLHNDILTIEVSYPGGCVDHNFDLYWTGEALDTNVNNVSTVELYLVHNKNGDACDGSGGTDQFDFDISDIKEEFDGKVNLHIYGGGNGMQPIYGYEV